MQVLRGQLYSSKIYKIISTTQRKNALLLITTLDFRCKISLCTYIMIILLAISPRDITKYVVIATRGVVNNIALYPTYFLINFGQ